MEIKGAKGVLKIKDQDWSSMLPPDKRTPRKAMIEAADNYFGMFTEKPTVSVPFASGLPDCHIFRMREGKVDLIQAVIGAGSPSMGWPDEPAE